MIIREKKFRRLYSDYVNSIDCIPPYKFIKFSNLLAKDRLTALMSGGDFGVPVDASKAYHAQMQNETKRETSPGVWRWVPVKQGAPNHLFDCEVMQVVAASILRVIVSAEEIKK
jgi:hypothetical protein